MLSPITYLSTLRSGIQKCTFCTVKPIFVNDAFPFVMKQILKIEFSFFFCYFFINH